jgi:hypothetical protein
MLRAPRFAATFAFELDPATRDAIRAQAHEIVIVSAERIADEMRRMLVHANRARAVELLHETRLLEVILPEARVLSPDSDEPPNAARGDIWRRTLAILERLHSPSFAVALAALLRQLPTASPEQVIAAVAGERWRLARHEWQRASWLLAHERLVRAARQAPWPRLQRVLIQPGAAELVEYGRAVAETCAEDPADIDFCAAKLALPRAELNPPPLLTGDDLQRLGLAPGPRFKSLLDDLRDRQLLGEISTRAEALQWLQRAISHPAAE